METRKIKIASSKSKELLIEAIPGHFATNHSHINYYIDMTKLKYTYPQNRRAGELLAASFLNSTMVDAVACTDGTEVIGGFIADALSGSSVRSINYGNQISVLSPEINTGGQMIFRDNIQSMVWNKNVLILVASATTGISVKRLIECIRYYGGKPVGVCAIFSAISEIEGLPIKRLFTASGFPQYRTFHASECPLCQNGTKLDAIVNSYGYSKI